MSAKNSGRACSGDGRRRVSGPWRWRCNRRARAGNRAFAPGKASSTRGRSCPGSGTGRRRSPAAAAHGRSAAASPRPGAARTATAPARPGWADASRAGSKSGCCWPADAAGRGAPESPSRSTRRAPGTSAPARKSRSTPPTRPASAPRTTASRRSWTERPDNDAPASGAGSAPRRASKPARRPPRAHPCRPATSNENPPFLPHPGRKVQNRTQSVVSTEFLSENEFALAASITSDYNAFLLWAVGRCRQFLRRWLDRAGRLHVQPSAIQGRTGDSVA